MKKTPCAVVLFALTLSASAGAADAKAPKDAKTVACSLMDHSCIEYASDSAQAAERSRKGCEELKGRSAVSCPTRDRLASCVTHQVDSVQTTYIYSYGNAEQDGRVVAGFKSACEKKQGTFGALR
jgi:hypothetical protein